MITGWLVGVSKQRAPARRSDHRKIPSDKWFNYVQCLCVCVCVYLAKNNETPMRVHSERWLALWLSDQFVAGLMVHSARSDAGV